MILLHRKSIVDCCSDFDCIVHEKEVKRILHKIDTMNNYYCFTLALTESWETGQTLKIIQTSSRYCYLHDVVNLYLDGNTTGFEFAVDNGDLVLISYQGKAGNLPYTKRTVAISVLEEVNHTKYHHNIDHDFIDLCAQLNPRLFKYI